MKSIFDGALLTLIIAVSTSSSRHLVLSVVRKLKERMNNTLMNDRIKYVDDDDGTAWSNGGISRSSHDSGLAFQNISVHSDDEEIAKLSDKEINNEEYLQLIKTIEGTSLNSKYFYDGVEEMLSHSDNEDDERFPPENSRISFTREQLVEYQQLTKLLRFIKSGGRCTTILSLALLNDHHLEDRSAFLAFKDSSTINVILNFLEMFDRDLKLNTLNVLENACRNVSFSYEIFRLGGVITIIDSMSLDHIGIEKSCSILSQLLFFQRARRVIRRAGGISKLISLLDELSEDFIVNQQVISDICRVFLLICKSEKNKYVAIRYGIGQILFKILLNTSSISIISLLAMLLQLDIFRRQMNNTDIIVSLMALIDITNIPLTRVTGYETLRDLLDRTDDSSIFCSTINLLTKFVENNGIISNDVLLNLIKFFKDSPNTFYLSRLILSLNQLTKHSQTIKLFKDEKIFSHLVFYLHTEEDWQLKLNILFLLQQSAKDPQAAKMIIENDGFQQLWTLFKLSSLPVQIAAGWTIRNCLASIEAHGELIRSFDGVFYLILTTLSTEHPDLLAVTLAIVAEIVKDEYNLEILTDLGIVSKISQLASEKLNPQLSKPFCNAVANLLDLPKNREQLGNRSILLTLKNYLDQSNSELWKPLTKSIYDLSLVPTNCVVLHEIGIASNLLQLIGHDDSFVQEKSANALRNMRHLLERNRQTDTVPQNSTRKPVVKRATCACSNI